MDYEAFNAFCAGLPATSHVVQWGGSHVWKVGDKVFAIGGWSDNDEPAFTFKVSEIAYEALKDREGLRPAPYFASRAMKWLQYIGPAGLTEKELQEYLRTSHHLASLNLTKKKQKELGFI
jgi:predicted DNA-binding protein (MmcQ/YjbR family)